MNINWGDCDESIVGGYPLKQWDWNKVETPFMPIVWVPPITQRRPMELQAILDKLLMHLEPEVPELAQLLVDIKCALEEQRITEQEYVSLMVDVERLRLIVKKMQSLEVDILVNEAIKAVIELAKMAKF